MVQTALAYCAIYCRISEDREGAGLGVERQEEDCRKIAAALGLIVVAVYVDNDISAFRQRKKKPREDYRRMLDDALAGRFSVIIAWHTDRLHRSPVELEEYIDVCDARKIPTYTVKAGNLDLSTGAGQMVARVLGAQAAYQSRHMSEQIIRKRKQLVDTGKSPGGPRPFGFERDGITIREAEAEEIRKGTKGIIGGQFLGAQVRDLTARGFKTTRGTEWTVTKWRNVLLRPRNAGILVYKEQEAGEAPWPAIVDELTWRQMREVLKDPKRRTAQSNRVASLGSGLYLCGICGAVLRMSTSGAGSKVRGYRCTASNHLTQAAGPLDAHVLHRLSGVLSMSDLVLRYLAGLEEGPEGTQAQERLHAAQKRLEDLGTMFAAGDIDARTLKSGTERARAEIAGAEQQIGRAGRKLSNREAAEIIDRFFGRREETLQSWPLHDQRWLLQFAATVTILPATVRGNRFDPGRVRFEWKPEIAAAIDASKTRSRAAVEADPVLREALRLVSFENGSPKD